MQIMRPSPFRGYQHSQLLTARVAFNPYHETQTELMYITPSLLATILLAAVINITLESDRTSCATRFANTLS